MSDQIFLHEVDNLLSLLRADRVVKLGAISWAAPVIAFGDPGLSQVATLGLNPSNLEFAGQDGQPLLESNKRFETLHSLRLDDWEQAKREDVLHIWDSCKEYFFRNPYDHWFGRLDKVLVGTGTSYYKRADHAACHLDLVPFATAQKWSALSREQREGLIELCIPSLIRTLIASSVKVLVLNGSTVVREFGRLLDKGALQEQVQTGWSLREGRVRGISYEGRISEIGSSSLGRELLVLGFNHNIQGTYGMTAGVVSDIAAWVARRTREAL